MTGNPYREGVHDGLERAAQLCIAAARSKPVLIRMALTAMAATIRALAKEQVR